MTSEEEIQRIQKAVETTVTKCLDDKRAIDNETHREHHAFIKDYLDERRRKKEQWDKIKANVIGWGVITTIGSIFSALGYAAYQWVKHINH